MSSYLYPHLVNSPFGDPGLFVKFSHEKKAIMFDMGDVSTLSSKQILTITHIFVTHTHLDHFFGFDRVLRLCLGKNKVLHIYGPPGIFKNTKGKLEGYQWNLLNKYKEDLIIKVYEIHKKYKTVKIFNSKNKFKASKERHKTTEDGLILTEKNFSVKALLLDHKTPCLGFTLQEQYHIKILSNELESMGIIPGKWINYLKYCLHNNLDKKTLIQVPAFNSKEVYHNVEFLEKKITRSIPGEKITYITDVNYSENNKKSILELAHKSTHLFIEATFLEKENKLATEKYHLTAKQAGQIARATESKRYTLFHHSPRYSHCQNRLTQEAKIAFEN